MVRVIGIIRSIAETYEINLVEFNGFKKERDTSRVKFILLRGMEDLPDNLSGLIGSFLGATTFNSNWKTPEKLDDKLKRLHLVVKEAKDRGKEVIFIAVSAGAALAMAYTLKNPDNVRHIYSLSGLLNPNLKKMDLSHLTSTSSSFNEVATYLTAELTPETIKRLHLSDKVSAYSSPKGKDSVVPFEATQPDWVKIKRYIGSANHAPTIARILIYDIRSQLNQAAKAKFD